MAWPKNINNVDCIGFPKNFLPILRKAIDRDMVTWGKGSMFAESCSAPFHWAGCEWELYEQSETVYKMVLKEGDLHTEDLTVAMLRG